MKKFRITAFLLSAIFMTIPSASCSRQNTENSMTINEALLSLRSANINMADDFTEILCTDKRSEAVLVFGMLNDGSYCGYKTDTKFSEKNVFRLEPQEGETVKTAALMRAGKTAVLTCLDDETFLYVFDVNGKLENTHNCGNIGDTSLYMTMVCYDDGFYVSCGREVIAYINANGEYVGSVNLHGKNICGIANNNEGIPSVLLSSGDYMYVGKLVNGELTDDVPCGSIGTSVNAVGSGFGECIISAVASNGLYVLKNNEWTKICDFLDNDFNPYNVCNIFMTAENEFAAIINRGDGKNEMKFLTERSIDEIKTKKIIKMSVMVSADSDINKDSFKKFNSESDEYKIEIVNYGETGDSPDDWSANLKRDIIAGEAPDIIGFSPDMSINSFGSRDNIFVDLYTLMENDSNLHREDFVDGFLEGFESDGKLLMIDSKFSLNSVCIKNKFANGLDSWNMEQFSKYYGTFPEDMILSTSAVSSLQKDVFMQLFNYSSFIDFENAVCHFDSPEFINAMKFIDENNIGLTNAEISNESALNYGFRDNIISAYRNDEAILLPWQIGSFYNFKELEQGFLGEPSTFIGFPSDNEFGTYRIVTNGYGIMANSDNIEGAWNFLKYYLFSENDNSRYSFSGLEKNLEKQLEAEKNLNYTEDPETGEKINSDVFSWFVNVDLNNSAPAESVMIDIEPFSDEDADKYDKIVREAVKNVCKYDSAIDKILREELDYYFEGERSADETAKIIQNRAELYLSEQYS